MGALLKGTVRSYDALNGTAEVELYGSHGQYITVPVATHLDGNVVTDGKRCAILSFDEHNTGDAVLVATYNDVFGMGAGPLAEHDHSGSSGSGGVFDVTNLSSPEGAGAGYVLLADGAGGVSFEEPGSLIGGVPAQRATMLHDEALVLSGGALTLGIDGTQIDNYSVQQSGAANGDEFIHGFYLAAGTYLFSVIGKTGPQRGKLDWYLNDVQIASGQDWYSSGATANVVKTVSDVVVEYSGWHLLRGEVNGKNVSSSGYLMTLTKYWFR